MITAEEYLNKYKTISNLINPKVINSIITILILLLLILVSTFEKYILIAYLMFFSVTLLIRFCLTKYRIKTLNKCIHENDKSNYNINKCNFDEEFKFYILYQLLLIIEENSINQNLYDKAFRNQLEELYKEKKNLLTDKPYITFMLGALFVSFIDSFYDFPYINLDLVTNINSIIQTTVILLVFIFLLSFMIYNFDSTLFNRGKEIKTLLNYTDLIMYSQE